MSLMERRPDTLFRRLSDMLDMPEPVKFFTNPRFGDMIRVEETVAEDKLVIRAELPGVDPDKDVEISISDGVLTINAERKEEKSEEKDGNTFSEFRYGSFTRSLTIPRDVTVDQVTATFKDGILSVTVPMPKAKAPTATKVPIART
jgi:HSP20 family protein